MTGRLQETINHHFQNYPGALSSVPAGWRVLAFDEVIPPTAKYLRAPARIPLEVAQWQPLPQYYHGKQYGTYLMPMIVPTDEPPAKVDPYEAHRLKLIAEGREHPNQTVGVPLPTPATYYAQLQHPDADDL